MNEFFLTGFEKQAKFNIRPILKGKIRLFVGDLPKTQRFMAKAHASQHPSYLFSNTEKEEMVTKAMEKLKKGELVIGRVVKSKKGEKVYIDRSAMLAGGDSLRNLVHHELFHKVPVLGRSEILANLWGGVHTKTNKIKNTIEDLKNLHKTRPERFAKELAVGGILGSGGLYGAHKLLKKDQDKK